MPRWLGALVIGSLGLFCAALPGCQGCDDPPIEPPPPPEFDLRGARLIEGDPPIPRFDRERRPLLLTTGPAPALDLAIVDHTGEAHRLPHAAHPIDGGLRLEAAPPETAPAPGDARLVVRAGDTTLLDRSIRWRTPPEALPGLSPIAAARRAGDVDAARRALAAVTDPTPEQALWLPVEAARVATLAGDLPAARAAWIDGARVAAARAIPTEQARRLNAAGWVALTQRDFVAMDRLTARAEAIAEAADDPLNQASIAHMRGVLALETGDWRAADARFDRALRLAERLGLDRIRRLVLESRALALGALGRHAEGLATLEDLHPALTDASPLDRSRFEVNRGWLALGAGRPYVARRAFETALAGAEQPARRANIELNLAHAAFERGDHRAAGGHLNRARAHGVERTHTLAAAMLDARLALAERRPEAAERFAAVDARARIELGPDGGDVAWRALHGQGQAVRGHDPEAAAALFGRALTTMARQGARAGLLGPRGAYFAARRALVGDAFRLALERGDPSAAFGIADRDRARILRAARTRLRVQRLTGPDRAAWLARAGALAAARDRLAELRRRSDLVAGAARAAWQVDVAAAESERRGAFEAAMALLDRAAPLDAGPDGADGDAIAARLPPDAWLVALLRVDDRWYAQRVTAAGLSTATITDDPLAPWRAALTAPGGPRHLYLVTGGHPRGFALATEARADAPPLLVTHTVSWLPHAGLLLRPPPTASGPPLIVADPGLDLPHARAAGRALAETLPHARLRVGPAATADALAEALPDARLLHFSGHGVLRQARPWDAHLRLAHGRRFDVVDILGLRMTGGRVVLNGCETGPEALLLRDDVLGLPEAFLAAGARSVIATDRPVPDAEARVFTERFYAAGGLTDPAGALRAVAGSLRAEGRPAWSAWRLLGAR